MPYVHTLQNSVSLFGASADTVRYTLLYWT